MFHILPLTACLFLLAGCGFNWSQQNPLPPLVMPANLDLSDQIHHEVDHYRRGQRKPPIPRHPELDALARDHAQFLADQKSTLPPGSKSLTHTGFPARSAAARHHGIVGLKENLVAVRGYQPTSTARSMRDLWEGSRTHRSNMRGNWSATGIGTAMAMDGTIIAVQLFGVSQ